MISNYIHGNTVGIFVAATGALIHSNNILNNGSGQAMDFGSGNAWDNGSTGNWWSDWTSPDADANGIVDVPRAVDGSAGSQDNYPLTWPAGSNILWLNVPDDSLYVQPGQPVVIETNVRNLGQAIIGCQALLGYEAGMLTYSSTTSPLTNDWEVLDALDDGSGGLDLLVGYTPDPDPGTGTSADATIAEITPAGSIPMRTGRCMARARRSRWS